MSYRRLAAATAVLAVALAAPPASLRAQADRRAELSGQVVDAATGAPIPGTLVVLAPHPGGVLPPAGAAPATAVATARRATTDAAGRYRFAPLPPGEYRLYASRLGYAPAALGVTLADAAPELSVGLTVAPLALRPVAVRAESTVVSSAPVTTHDRDLSGDTRVQAARLRQRDYLAPDVRELTPADVGEAVTLAESDVFRALHRLPGVSTRDEWAAELWTRGARADQTRVYFDGLPIFSPLHAFGLLGAVNPDAVGAAFLHPGVRPASIAEGGAAVLDLRSRPGGRDSSRLGGASELSVTSARLALDGSALGGRLGWSAAGRRSWADYLVRAIGQNQERLPTFHDLFGRADYRLGGGRTLTLSGVDQRDASLGRGFGFGGTDAGAVWGDRALRATLVGAPGRWRISHTLALAAHRFDSRPATRWIPSYTTDSAGMLVGRDSVSWTTSGAEVRVRYASLGGQIEPATGAGWSAGWELTRQSADYGGPGRTYYTGDEWERGRDDTTLVGQATVGALWASRRWRLAPRLTVEPGLRLEIAPGLARPVRPAPRLAARWAVDEATSLSAAVGRAVQYTQGLPRVGLADEVRFYPSALWTVAGRGIPALSTDLATLGAERWLGGGWLASANVYARRATGVVTNDPTPGLSFRRRLFVAGTERAQGVELSARRLAGRVTGAVAYSYGVSTLDAAGYHYPSPQDRRHALDLTLSGRVSGGWRLGAAFSAASGAPYTETARAITERDSLGGWIPGAYRSALPNARRRAPLFGADVQAEWTRRFAGWTLGSYFQLHSPLAQKSSGSYRGESWCSSFAGETTSGCPDRLDPRADTFPVIPTLGLRITF